MRLVFKNKILMAFDKTLREAEKLGGIPKIMILTAPEAVELIRECQELHREGHTPLPSFEHTDSSNATVKFKVYGVRDLTNQDFLEIVNQWNRGEILVTYSSVPIHIERKPKKEDTKEW